MQIIIFGQTFFMRKTHLVFLCCILFACAKSSVEPTEIRLQRIVVTNTGNTDTTITSIEYDTQGRVISLSDKINGGALTNQFNISYVNGEIIIKAFPQNELKGVQETRYAVNSNGLPVKRIAYQYLDFNDVGTNQKIKYYDTTVFEYSAGGLLLKTTRNLIDTLVYIPAGMPTENTVEAHTITGIYTSDNNLMKSYLLTDLYSSTKRVGANIYTTKFSHEFTTIFEYLKNYSNQFDYSNTVVMNECFFIFNGTDYFNKNYKSLPDKIIGTSIAKDANGNITSTYSYPIQIELVNKNGFLSELKRTENGNTSTKTFIYNK